VIQQGQVFKFKARGADGEPLWAYRYRLEGAGRHGHRWAGSRIVLRRRWRWRKRSHGSVEWACGNDHAW
jgi:hypothetical protein